MVINIITLGKLKEKYLRDAVNEYLKRLSPFCRVLINEINPIMISEKPTSAEIENALLKEAEIIKSKIMSGYTITMCIEGTQISSEEFAEKINKIAVSGKSAINIIIGSSFGLHESIKRESDFKLSFSKMTFPHQLARVMLLEQIYRAYMINHNTKYHK